jgi:hypothetical protein
VLRDWAVLVELWCMYLLHILYHLSHLCIDPTVVNRWKNINLCFHYFLLFKSHNMTDFLSSEMLQWNFSQWLFVFRLCFRWRSSKRQNCRGIAFMLHAVIHVLCSSYLCSLVFWWNILYIYCAYCLSFIGVYKEFVRL